MTHRQRENFLQTLWAYYDKYARTMPWRQTTDPYKIMVSEVMLQQTTVGRALPKYREFITKFPNIEALASAPLDRVLVAWSGLGYNRRAKYLHQSAKQLIAEHTFPKTQNALVALPGIGANTAGAILAYAFDKPAVFIETNIRTVLIYHFFSDKTNVPDKALLDLLGSVISHVQSPREFYWAMMDYGTYLKKTIGNLNVKSKSYSKQSAFAGSKRQIRGQVLKLLIEKPRSSQQIAMHITDDRLNRVLSDLMKEQLVIHKDGVYCLG